MNKNGKITYIHSVPKRTFNIHPQSLITAFPAHHPQALYPAPYRKSPDCVPIRQA